MAYTGRTGRFGRKGCSVIFVHDDRSKRDVDEIMAELGKPMKKIDARRSADLEQLEKVGTPPPHSLPRGILSYSNTFSGAQDRHEGNELKQHIETTARTVTM